MKLSEKKGGDFQPHPETDGMVKAVLVDITPLKKRQTEFGEKEEFRFVFETEVKDDDNKTCCIWSRGYTPSLNPKAALRKDLKKMLGRDLTDQEKEEFEVEVLIGKGYKLIVQHDHKDDKTYANISFIQPDKDDPLKPTGKYIRVKDREDKKGANGEGGSEAGYRKAPATGEDEGRQAWQKVKVHVGTHAGVDLGDLDEEAVGKLIEKWLPKAKEMTKPLKADRDLMAALEEVAALLAGAATPEPAKEEEY